VKQIYPDLWQTGAEHPFPGLTTHAYLLVRDAGNVLFYSSGQKEEYQHIQDLGGISHNGRLSQPMPAMIRASFVALSLSRHVPGDSTPKSCPSVNSEGSSATIWMWSANSKAVSGSPLSARMAKGCIAAATAARDTNANDSSSIAGPGYPLR
jgi:hypothetical protein